MNFPNVPQLPGVPPVLRDPLAAAATIAAPFVGSLLDSMSPTFGLFDQANVKLVDPDSFLGIDYTNPLKISAFPIEKGSFQNYNKVNNPFLATVRLAKGGTKDDRDNFLKDLQKLSNSLDLVKLVTPEAVYLNTNLESFSYRRSANNGANMIIAELKFVEIRLPNFVKDTTSITKAKKPSLIDKVMSGLKSPLAAAKSVASKATDFISKGI